MSPTLHPHSETHAEITDLAFRPFIVTTSLDKTDDVTRKLIRSHVMRGKNKGKPRPRKAQTRRPGETGETPDSAALTQPTSSEDKPSSTEEPELSCDNGAWKMTPPRKIASELSLFRYTMELNPSMRELIYRGWL